MQMTSYQFEVENDLLNGKIVQMTSYQCEFVKMMTLKMTSETEKLYK